MPTRFKTLAIAAALVAGTSSVALAQYACPAGYAYSYGACRPVAAPAPAPAYPSNPVSGAVSGGQAGAAQGAATGGPVGGIVGGALGTGTERPQRRGRRDWRLGLSDALRNCHLRHFSRPPHRFAFRAHQRDPYGTA